MPLILSSILCQLGAVLLLKQHARLNPAFGLAELLLHPLFWAALACLGLQAILWQKVLSRQPLSHVYPLNSLIYPASLLAGWALFAEPVTPGRLAGSLVILGGIWLMSRRPAA